MFQGLKKIHFTNFSMFKKYHLQKNSLKGYLKQTLFCEYFFRFTILERSSKIR